MAIRKSIAISAIKRSRVAPTTGHQRCATLVAGLSSGLGAARGAHPPIDSILLGNLRRAAETPAACRKALSTIRWTKLDEGAYYQLINLLRGCLRAGEPMWHLEQFWTVSSSTR